MFSASLRRGATRPQSSRASVPSSPRLIDWWRARVVIDESKFEGLHSPDAIQEAVAAAGLPAGIVDYPTYATTYNDLCDLGAGATRCRAIRRRR